MSVEVDTVISANATDDSFLNAIYASEYNPWYGSVLGALLVGLSGVIPLLIFPIEELGSTTSTKTVGGEKLKLLLSFAVGGLLGDVFLHLLPEAWSHQSKNRPNGDDGSHVSLYCGSWVLTGLLVFIICEKLLSKIKPPEEETTEEGENNNVTKLKDNSKQISGYLNLLANVIDNFTHGLTVGGSFLLSWRVGVFTTLTILVHEVPHEVGDFAILLRAGFSKLGAVKAQLATASSSLFGACTAVFFSSTSHLIEEKTTWILPFTAGGFLHIALVTVLPDLVQESSPKESVKQLSFLVLGIAVVATLTAIVEE